MIIYNEQPDIQSLQKKLYHYTNKEGLLGIAEKSQIWATHILFLNDRTEFYLALDKIKSVLIRMSKKLKYKAKIDVRRAITFYLEDDIEKEDAYIFSFSEEYDNLNMWVKYTDMTPGFCLSFDPALLSQEILKNNHVKISHVLYNKSEQENELKKIINEAEIITDQNPGDTPDDTFTCNLYNRFLEIAPFIKHESFQDEKEWRIVIRTKRADTKLRSKGSVFIPYYTLKMCENIINDITIGPGGSGEYVKQSVDFLCSRHLKNIIKPQNSKVPYR